MAHPVQAVMLMMILIPISIYGFFLLKDVLTS